LSQILRGQLSIANVDTSAIIDAALAQDTRLHAFVNDGDSQFVDIWRNINGTITIKASNGKPSRDMNLRIIVYFFADNLQIGTKEFRNIYCPAPNGYGPGKECWYENMSGPSLSGVTKISAESHKQS
jgi:hypothetical protein